MIASLKLELTPLGFLTILPSIVCLNLKFIKNFIKKRLQHRFFPVKFSKNFKSTYFLEHIRTTTPKIRFFGGPKYVEMS